MKKALRERPLVRGERVVAHGLVREVVEKIVPMPLEFVEEDGIGIVAWSEDDVCAAFIERLFGHEVVVPKGLLLFSHVSDDDLVRYADLCNLSFTPREKPVTWSLFFPLFEKHPDMRRNCARSSTELEFSFEE